MKEQIIKNNKGSRFIKSYSTCLKRSPEYSKGFTLVETLFAVLILTFTIAGLMTIVANSLFSARYAKDEITVNYLMQEVVDYIRNDRDTTVFFGDPEEGWNNFYSKYSNCSELLGGCSMDLSQNPVVRDSCVNGICPVLQYHSNATSGSFYNYDRNNSAISTNFKRRVIVGKSEDNPNEIIVKVEMKWKNGSKEMERSLSTSLTNW